MFQAIASRFFGSTNTSSSSTFTGNLPIHTLVPRVKKVRFNEQKNKVYILPNMSTPKRKQRFLSIETKPYVPPVGTVLTDKTRSGVFSAVVVLPDHRLLEVQRGNYAGLQLGPCTIFPTPFDWQTWLRNM